MNYFLYFSISLFLCAVLTKLIIILSKKFGFFDVKDERKIHQNNVSRLGGIGIIISFIVAILFLNELVIDYPKIGVILCSLVILFFGLWDDFKNISWKKQLFVQILVAIIMIYFGLSVDYIANPFGGSEFRLDSIMFNGFSILGSVFVVLWIIGFMNVVNWLDGMDGMASGVGGIGAFTIFFLSISSLVNQPSIAIMAISLAGALLGFLIFNFHPAKIFMGSTGAWFIGFILSVLAIFSGGKIATLFLVFSIPIFDAIWVVVKRFREGKSIFSADRSHFFHNLMNLGWGQRKIVILTYLICIVCSLFALYFKGLQKFLAIAFLFFIVFLFLVKFSRKA